jgi:hypothetical protein
MSTRTLLIAALRLLAVTLVHFITFAVVAAALIGQPEANQPPPQDAGRALLALLVVSLANSAVLSFLILGSKWAGWRLAVTLFVVFFGVMTVMSQIETALFVTTLPSGMLPRLFAMGALVAAIVSPLAVLIWGKQPRTSLPEVASPFSAASWVWRLSAAAVAYVVLYFTFGYFVAWRVPEVRQFYGGSESGGFFAHMGGVLRDTPWVVFIQVGRGMMWTLLALPVVRMMKGGAIQRGLAVALLFAVVMNAQLLLPNPYMPEVVRMAHLIETASSNFIFGWIAAWVLTPRS